MANLTPPPSFCFFTSYIARLGGTKGIGRGVLFEERDAELTLRWLPHAPPITMGSHNRS